MKEEEKTMKLFLMSHVISQLKVIAANKITSFTEI